VPSYFVTRCETKTPEETEAVGAQLAASAKPGDVFLLEGELGAGKTTLVRGFLHALGYDKAVRSPTFGLVQIFETIPPVMHADLYRVAGWQGLGIEDYLETHVCFIEWPERATGLVEPEEAWCVHIEFKGDGRTIEVKPPKGAT